jgi:ArsR family transcriptional regulator
LVVYAVVRIFRRVNIVPQDLFAALAHETRLRSLLLLLLHEELCVCELTHALGAAQPHISRHLGHLRELGLVVDRRAGLWIHYRINPELPDWVYAVLRAVAEGVGAQAPHREDAVALALMPNRPGAPRCA